MRNRKHPRRSIDLVTTADGQFRVEQTNTLDGPLPGDVLDQTDARRLFTPRTKINIREGGDSARARRGQVILVGLFLHPGEPSYSVVRLHQRRTPLVGSVLDAAQVDDLISRNVGVSIVGVEDNGRRTP